MGFLGGDDACKHNYSTYTKGNKKSVLPYLTNLLLFQSFHEKGGGI